MASDSTKVVHVCAIGFTAKRLLLPQCDYLRSLGYDIGFVFTPDAVSDELRDLGYDVADIEIPRSINSGVVSSVDALSRYLKHLQPDIVHTHTSMGGAIGRLAAHRAQVPHVIHTIHGFPFAQGQPWYKYRMYCVAEKSLARITDVLLSQSREDVETAIELGILAREGPPLLIGNGINTQKFTRCNYSDDDKTVLKRLLRIGEEPVITTIARLTLEKGYAELVDALASCVDLPWTALFIGPDDGDANKIRSLAGGLGLNERIRFLGQRDDVATLLSMTDIFVLPSYREGVPRSLIEAQCMGVPAVATDIRGCREIVVDGRTGLLVPPRDREHLAQSIRQLIQDENLRRSWGSQAEKHARDEFDEDMVFRRIAKAYERLIAKNI